MTVGCCFDRRGEPNNLDRDQCHLAGDTWQERSKCEGNCTVVGALAYFLQETYAHDSMALLAARGTFHTVYDVRDNVLATTPIGQEFLDVYKRYSESVFEVVRSDPDLLKETMRLVLIGASFAF